MFRGSYAQKIFDPKVLCSDASVSYSEDPMFKNICSEGPILRWSYMFRRSYIQKYLFRRFYIQKVLCSEGPIFRRSFVQKVLCWNSFPSFIFRYKNMSRFFFIFFINLLFTSSRDTREWVPKLRRSRNFKFHEPPSSQNLETPNPSFEVLSSCVAFCAVSFL